MAGLFAEPAWWGLCGSFIYGAPRLHACLTSPKEHETAISCLLEFAIALAIGAIGAAAFGPWIAAWRGLSEPRDLNAVAAIIGLMARDDARTSSRSPTLHKRRLARTDRTAWHHLTVA